ncbi:AfsA-related hotdog domain-containing protein [Actinophytocola sp.]|uniref:AfsA-related hotdog domain-containing protein n=1 Tax=Actinophytocola sp. TaxID=1872138 RepID=UPI003D6A01CA
MEDPVEDPVEDKDVSHLQILPKALVHKDGFDDVFLTSFAVRGPRESVLGATLPRSHGFYCELPVSNRVPDLATLIEICRQACFVVAHEQFDVPLGGAADAKFLMRELSGEFVDTTPFDTDEPVNVAVDCEVEHVVRRAGQISGLVWAFTVRVGEVVAGRARMAQTLMSRTVWGQLRGRLRTERGLPTRMAEVRPPGPSELAPADVGRLNPDNVVLTAVSEGDGGYQALIRADLRHPVMFDHPADYIFAMVQLEACRQLSLVAASRRLAVPATRLEMCGVTAEYRAVAEFDLPTVLHARFSATPAADRSYLRLDVDATQQGRVVSTFGMSVRPSAGAHT